MNRISNYYATTREEKIEFAKDAFAWLRFLSEPHQRGFLRTYCLDPLGLDFFDAECRVSAHIAGIVLDPAESLDVFGWNN